MIRFKRVADSMPKAENKIILSGGLPPWVKKPIKASIRFLDIKGTAISKPAASTTRPNKKTNPFLSVFKRLRILGVGFDLLDLFTASYYYKL